MTVSGSTAANTAPTTSPLAGKPAPDEVLVDVARLLAAYDEQPDPQDPAQRVSFGTSGHRGSSLRGAFNEAHILAITQAICEHRAAAGIGGPMFVGIDTHALSLPALRSAVEVLAAHDVDVRLTADDSPTPTPVISHAILGHNREAQPAQADGIVITPSHNPPEDGGFKYDPPSGGPADSATTKAIQDRANELLLAGFARRAAHPVRAGAGQDAPRTTSSRRTSTISPPSWTSRRSRPPGYASASIRSAVRA